MHHSFDSKIASKYGVNEAIFLNNLAFWVQRNQGNKKNFFDNRHWTFNSQKAFSVIFPYWTRQNLRTIIKSCINQNLILKGNYNESKYDRTDWYTLSDLGLELFNLPIGENQPRTGLESTASLVETNQPIPDIKTHILKQDLKSSCASDDARAKIEQSFEIFWEPWRKKENKVEAKKVFIKKKLYLQIDEIVEFVNFSNNNNPQWQERRFIPDPARFLRNERWKDEKYLQKEKPQKETTSNLLTRNAMQVLSKGNFL